MPSKEFEALLEEIRARPVLTGLTIEERRANFEAMPRAPLAEDVECRPVDVGGRPDVVGSPDVGGVPGVGGRPDVGGVPATGGVPCEWITVAESRDDRVLLYLHGGGYVMGSVKTHRELASRLARVMGARALSVDYRLAPEDPFPAAVADAASAYRWLLAEGVDPSGIVIAGDSAGGGLAMACLVALRDAESPLPAAAVCLSPWTDMECVGDSLIQLAGKGGLDPVSLRASAMAYVGEADPREPLASPIHADLTGLPPLLIQVSKAEELYSDATRLAERARACGVETEVEAWEDMTHVWQMSAGLIPEGREAIEDVGRFVKKRLG